MAIATDLELRVSALRAAVDAQPRVHLGQFPTPLDEAPRLTAALGGARIFIKREDLTGLAFGGNKTRILEFTIGAARSRGAEVIVASAFAQSNHCRQAAAAGARLGMRVVLVLGANEHAKKPYQGNLLLDELLGAEIRWVDQSGDGRDLDSLGKRAEQVAADLRATGVRAESVTLGPVPASHAAVSYVSMTLELVAQCAALGIDPDALYVCSSGTTAAGLALAKKILGLRYHVVGITSIHMDDRQKRIATIANDAARLLGYSVTVDPSEVENTDQYVGERYGKVTSEGIAAMRLVARTEGILLDPVYTGKAMSGLIDHIRTGQLGKDKTVVFVHTGGTPLIFAYNREIAGA